MIGEAATHGRLDRRFPMTRARFSLLTAIALSACTVGPDYVPATAPTPEDFKELRGKAFKGWKVAAPRDSVDTGPWWQAYRDPMLDSLETQVEISNQTVAAAAAAYEQARTLIREAQAALFPTVTASYGVTRQYTGAALISSSSSLSGSSSALPVGATGATSRHGVTTTVFTTQGNLTWDLDVWGKIRRQLESEVAGAQVSAADLANVKLAAQAQLAIAYFNLRAAYSLKNLLETTAAEYRRTLDITRNQYKAGTVSQADVVAAETQLLSTQAQAVSTGVTIAQLQHAIAILTGRPPADLDLPPMLLTGRFPSIPVSVPSALLERRPDIAAAERMMQQENALIGVALAAYYPDITLSANLGYTGLVPLPINPAHEFWSLGALALETVVDGGLRSAQVDSARAAYRQSVANYRQTVLTAFQQVEDQLAAVRTLTAQLKVQEKAVGEARKAVTVYLNQYRAGFVAFTSVVVAEAALLADEQAALATRQNLFVASVALIEALGGGWDKARLPGTNEVSTGISLFPQLSP
jgi:NodT family efflux transporter outer membrane factor (OMF) lipoprotein